MTNSRLGGVTVVDAGAGLPASDNRLVRVEGLSGQITVTVLPAPQVSQVTQTKSPAQDGTDREQKIVQ